MPDGRVRAPRVERAGVVRRDDRDGCDVERTAGTEDPHRDLAAIRYEQALHPGGL